jgi:carbon storage regulator
MLVVTRRTGEAIVIELPTGELIEMVVLSLKGKQVKLGTDAPKHLPVVREELLERVES